jgi:hypothetical protein
MTKKGPLRFRAPLLGALFAMVQVALASNAHAQLPARGRRGAPPAPDEAKPDDTEDTAPQPRTEPDLAPPSNPLLVSPDVRARIGSDSTTDRPSPVGPLSQTGVIPYEERQGDYRLRLLPPFLIEQTRGLRDPSQARYGIPSREDTEGLYGLLYYRRRSPKLDVDTLFPALWHVRDENSYLTVVGPLVHREAPGEHDNWLAPLYFEGGRKDGGYFHAPLLLTTSHWSPSGAFTLVGPYFRARDGASVDAGLAPLLFHGDNGDILGNRRDYTLIPPLLFYHSDHELDGSSTTVAGPIIVQSDPKRDVFDVAPLFFHIRGKPTTGGVTEEHTTLLPFFHYGYDSDESLFIVPGYYRHVSRTSDTMLTPFYSRAMARGGATTLSVAGPVLPLWWDYRDRDLDQHTWALAPLYYSSDSPAGHDWLTPLVGRFETYGESKTWWVFPTLTLMTDKHGWENDLHPLVYVGKSDDSTHTVIAPIFWDFGNSKGRTTVGFPLYWRVADSEDDSVVQVAANTLYMQKRVPGGTDWQFHLLPLFSYGENPGGYFWNVLFGLAGYTRDGAQASVRAFWIPIDVSGSSPASKTATAR